jgi:hypothetical protein
MGLLYLYLYIIIRLQRISILCYDGKTISDSSKQKHSIVDPAEDVECHSDTYMADVHKVSNKSRNPLSFLGARRETRSKFHNKDPQILGGKAQNFVGLATW